LRRLVWLSLLACGCGHEPDPRFASPQATIDTLFAAYGIEGLSQDEIQARLREHGQFELRDQASFRLCFLDYSGPRDEGLAGFVFGMIAAGKDDLVVRAVDDRATVFPDPDRVDRSVVMLRRSDEWKISLRDSVPAAIREALFGEFERASARESDAVHANPP
jgi:hypothetical protein